MSDKSPKADRDAAWRAWLLNATLADAQDRILSEWTADAFDGASTAAKSIRSWQADHAKPLLDRLCRLYAAELLTGLMESAPFGDQINMGTLDAMVTLLLGERPITL